MSSTITLIIAICLAGLTTASAQTISSTQDTKTSAIQTQTRSVEPKVRQELFDARERAWRSFFQNDPIAVEQILGPELIAIQESQERWEDRDRLLAMAKEMTKQRIELRRLEFPKTEIQVFGKTAILYYTYILETGPAGRPSAVNTGRGTEIFVKRQGKWIDVGWHIDNGAFRMQNGTWTKVDS